MGGRLHKAKTGKYKVINPDKYLGDPTRCVYRSSWELTLMKQYDHDHTIVKWGSEPFPIKYISPKDGRYHRYYVDFIVRTSDCVYLIEVKPYKETIKPVTHTTKGKRRAKKTLISEAKTYLINQAKWAAAEIYCEKKGWKFVKMTEREIFTRRTR